MSPQDQEEEEGQHQGKLLVALQTRVNVRG